MLKSGGALPEMQAIALRTKLDSSHRMTDPQCRKFLDILLKQGFLQQQHDSKALLIGPRSILELKPYFHQLQQEKILGHCSICDDLCIKGLVCPSKQCSDIRLHLHCADRAFPAQQERICQTCGEGVLKPYDSNAQDFPEHVFSEGED